MQLTRFVVTNRAMRASDEPQGRVRKVRFMAAGGLGLDDDAPGRDRGVCTRLRAAWRGSTVSQRLRFASAPPLKEGGAS
jgi:hypothetical protein